MKKMMLIIALTALGFVSQALALDQFQLDNRIRMLASKFDAMQHSGKAVPADYLRKAKGIIILDRTKAGFIFAYQGGGGVALVKDRAGNWSPAAFLTATEASLGFQIGCEQNFYVILLMNTNATQLLTDSVVELGGEAHGTGGDQTATVEGKLSAYENSVMIFDSRKGLFGGASVKGGALSPDNDANEIYYGKYLTVGDILFDHKVAPTEATKSLIEKISTYSQ